MSKEAALRVSVLLVEDDEDDYLLTNDLLGDIPNVEFDLDWVSTPDDARRELRLNRHDICLLDYRLGPEEGTELLKQAPFLGFTAPIIMLTGQDDSEKDALAMRLGAVDYLLKSHLDAHQLSRAVRYALARREAEVERLKRLRAQSENDSKSQFLAHISHEIRTPLTAILGFTELMINKQPDKDVLQGLQVIQRNGQHLRSLLNDVLDFSKIEAGQLELEVAEVRLGDVLADVWSIFSVAAEDKGIELLFKTGEMLPEAIMTDAVRLRQILINLIGNAVKFTDKGSVTLTVSCPTSSSETLNQLSFEVRDTGPGVPPEAQHLLFKPFAQAGTSLTRMEGTGLGLAISQQLAERLDGSIRYRAPEGGGACFTLDIGVGELAGAARAPLTLDARRGIDIKPVQKPLEGTVLVVDDVEDIRHLIGQWVGQTGAKVEFAADGEAAVEKVTSMKAQHRSFSVILMDIQMPLMDGHEATRQIRALGFGGPIIALTAATLQGDREKCLESGCNSFLSKPLNPGVLTSALRRAMPVMPPAANQIANVLLVEDDEDSANAMAFLLRHLGCTVAIARSGAETFEQLQQASPELILLDLNLPDTHGFDLAGQIREAGFTECRICILSGEAVSADAARAAGADDCFLKPVDLATLKSMTG
ncbi:response regulator [Allohahella marinimesophila]|uniref:histidine kinase n=1 Tax=Allohahella marinimesophila TaxID=1054972 RepID=A0ABP7PFK0_9GAMM